MRPEKDCNDQCGNDGEPGVVEAQQVDCSTDGDLPKPDCRDDAGAASFMLHGSVRDTNTVTAVRMTHFDELTKLICKLQSFGNIIGLIWAFSKIRNTAIDLG